MSTTVRAVRSAYVWALLIIAIVVLGVIVWQQRESSPPDASNSLSALGQTEDQADASELPATLDRLESAWKQRNRNAFVAAAGESAAAKSWGGQTYDSLDELGVKSIELGFVGDRAERPHNDGTYDATVSVRWTPGAATGLPTRRTDPVTVRLRVRRDARLSIESVTATKDPMPLWLSGSLGVTRSDDATVVRVDGGSEEPRLDAMLDEAMADVRRVYGKPTRDAFVVVPAEGTQSTEIVGGSPSRLSQIAAITTSLDGSGASNGPVAIVLNPEVFTPMDARAAQIVLTHEATHEATGAATAVLPLWVAEGYADYVALDGDRLDPTRSASQILQRVRKHGPPKTLPQDDDFGAASPTLGATYEGAWMVFRMLGERYGQDAVTEFYRRVLNGVSTEVAARRTFSVDLDRITADWRDYLKDWADAPR